MPWHNDLALSRRLERAEAVANARFVEARARVFPASGAEWIEAAGAYAMYDGPESPCTQTFGLGLFELPSAADMDRIEAFYEQRAAPVFHEVSPLADKALLGILKDRCYCPVELTSILCMPLDGRVPREPLEGVHARLAGGNERELWALTAAEAWREYAGSFAQLPDIMRIASSRSDAALFFAECEGRPIATGALEIHDGVGLLAGAGTIPEWRRRGAQRALLDARLAHAFEAGCDVAMIGAEPGGPTQRNVERLGFRLAYTRIKWERGKI